MSRSNPPAFPLSFVHRHAALPASLSALFVTEVSFERGLARGRASLRVAAARDGGGGGGDGDGNASLEAPFEFEERARQAGLLFRDSARDGRGERERETHTPRELVLLGSLQLADAGGGRGIWT